MKNKHATGTPIAQERSAAGMPLLPHVRAAMPPIDVSTQPRRYSVPLKLVALPNAAGCARRYARAQARAWQLHDLAGCAELLASELVARAVATTGAPAPASYAELYDSPLSFVILRMQAHGPGLVIEVWDRDPAPPIPRMEPAGTETQLRLRVLATMSSRWGYYPGAGGKIVWCECVPEPRAAGSAATPAVLALAQPAGQTAR